MIRFAHFAALPILVAVTAAVLWFSGEFNVAHGPAWTWLAQYVRYYQNVPDFVMWSLYGGVGAATAYLLLVQIIASRVSADTIVGGRKQSELHGSARWAVWKDIKRAGLVLPRLGWGQKLLVALRLRPTPPSEERGVVVGGFVRPSSPYIKRMPRTLWRKLGRILSLNLLSWHRTVELLHDGPEHVLCYAPTRSGKGVGLVIPTLLRWRESVLVLDIKGENYAKTAGWRHSIKQRVIKFEPAALDGSAGYNPLAEVRLRTLYEISDVQNIVAMIVNPTGTDNAGGKDGNYFRDAGEEWLTACVIYTMYSFWVRGKQASLTDVHFLMTAKEIDDLCDDMRKFDHDRREASNTLVHNTALGMMNKVGPEKSGVHSTAVVKLKLYVDPIIAKNIRKSDFKISDLMNGDKPVSLYLILPPNDIDRLRPLFRIMLNQILNRLCAEMKHGEEKAYKHRLLLMLDEFTAIGKLNIFQRAIGYMAGYGLKAFIIVQDLMQLQSAETGYGKEESISGNCDVTIAYAPKNPQTAEVLSKMAGKATVVQKKRSVSGKATDTFGSVSESLSETSRPLLTPDECLTLKKMQKETVQQFNPKTKQWDKKEFCVDAGDMLIFTAGCPPIHGRQTLYFEDPELRARSDIKMPSSLPEANTEDKIP